MIEIRTFLGRKLDYINGIYRRQIELDKPLKNRDDIKLKYYYYYPPSNAIDFIGKRFILTPFYGKKQENNPNIINHITFQELADLAIFLDKKRTILTCHDIFTFIDRKNLKKPYFLQKYLLFGLKKCQYIISISEFTKYELIKTLKIPKEKIKVIKNGVNHKMFFPLNQNDLLNIAPILPNYKKILHVGDEAHRKNFITLLKAFYKIKKERDDIKLIRIGEQRHTSIIKDLGLQNDIIYINNVSNERLREIYNLCDIYIFPSLYEGWGAPGLEAAACGTPIICSDISIFREIYQDFPHYFPAKDHKNLSKSILEIIDNDIKKFEMSKKGLEISKLYSWKNSADKYVKLIKMINENS